MDNLNNQNGRSMIEMLGVLAIIGVLSVGGIAGYSKAMQKYRVNKTIEQITLIAGNIRAFFGPQKNYEGVHCYCNSAGCTGQSSRDGCPVIKKAKIIPDEMLTLDSSGNITAITNTLGDDVSLSVGNKSTLGDRKAFCIEYGIGHNNMETCIELMTHDWKSADVNAIVSRDGVNHCLKTPISIEDAVTHCSDSYLRDLYFYFDIDINGSIWEKGPDNGLLCGRWQN